MNLAYVEPGRAEHFPRGCRPLHDCSGNLGNRENAPEDLSSIAGSSMAGVDEMNLDEMSLEELLYFALVESMETA